MPPIRLTALFAFLEAHRGEMFCAACLAKAIGTLGRLDAALAAAEGRGVRRVYGLCATCDRGRLVCGLPSGRDTD